MYEELIKRLRTHVGWTLNKTLDEAADAIEELSAKYDMALTDLVKQTKPRWIPVTERLPEDENARYLVASDLMSGLWVSICYFARNLEAVDEYDFAGKHRSGFYFSDDEYSYIEKDNVRYWMPLPEPPKEEAE